MKKYVLGFMFSSDRKKVVLIRKNKPTWQAGSLNGVGGKTEEGETSLQAIIREFQEETGCEFNDWNLFATMTNSQFIVDCFVAFANGGERIETMTDELVFVLPVVEILADEHKIIPNLKWLITMALDKGFEPVTISYHEADKYVEPTK